MLKRFKTIQRVCLFLCGMIHDTKQSALQDTCNIKNDANVKRTATYNLFS